MRSESVPQAGHGAVGVEVARTTQTKEEVTATSVTVRLPKVGSRSADMTGVLRGRCTKRRHSKHCPSPTPRKSRFQLSVDSVKSFCTGRAIAVRSTGGRLTEECASTQEHPLLVLNRR